MATTVRQKLFRGGDARDSLTIEGARVVDPVEGIDACLKVTVEEGIITALEPATPTREGLVLAPAFVDPHVHLRTPGREDEEDIASGTAAAAAGGFCAILAMPNTHPVVDSAAVLGALVELALEEARIPVGFLAAITKSQEGKELTEMVELAERGAVGFSDDGRPVVSAGVMRRALQYNAASGGLIALHEEDPTLTRGAHMHEGAVSAELGIGGYPSIPSRPWLPATSRSPVRSRPHPHPSPLRTGVGRGASAGTGGGRRHVGEVSPHHLCLTDEVVRWLDPNVKMSPPLRTEEDRLALVDALRDGTIACIATDHAPHARHEKDAPFEEAPNGVPSRDGILALYTRLVRPGILSLETVLERNKRPAQPGHSSWRCPGSPSVPLRTSCCSTWQQRGASPRPLSRRNPPTRGYSAAAHGNRRDDRR